VTDPALVGRLNQKVLARYAHPWVFGPGADSVAVVHLRPETISTVGVNDGRSKAQSF
jgi:hypothetical protein